MLQHQRHRNFNLTDSQVRVRGVAGAEVDGHHRFHGFQLYVSSLKDITIVDAPAIDAFARPVSLGRELVAPMPAGRAEHRLRVRGVVTMQWPGRVVFLRDATRGICLQTVRSLEFRVGELVEAVGFRVVGELTPQLEAAVVRSVGMSVPPAPLRLSPTDKLDDRLNCNLVQFEARLTEVHTAPPDQVCLSLQAFGQSWTAFLQSAEPELVLADLVPGSQLRVTGVCQFVSSGQRGPRRLELWLRSPDDVESLAVPLTARQMVLFWTCGTLAVGLVGGGGLLFWIRRRNRRRLLETLEARRRHLHRHLEERKRIGQDLHDNIMPSIYAVGLGLEDCRRLMQQSPAKAEEQIAIATRTLNAVLQDVRHFVGGLETRTFRGDDLSSALNSLALATGENSSQFVIQTHPDAAQILTPHQATQLLKVAKEAMSNSLRHAKANQTRVALQMAQDHVRLEISDDGVGFDPHAASHRGNGLRNLAARARDLGARCEIISAFGKGTRVVLDLPPRSAHDIQHHPS
ncbi:MAG: sensor histidine kinase [Verrucomicrobiota bacterium]